MADAEIKPGDLVRAPGVEEVLKVERIQSIRNGDYQARTGRERMRTAECWLPPYDNPNRFQNWNVDDLEKVDEVADRPPEKAKAKKPKTGTDQ